MPLLVLPPGAALFDVIAGLILAFHMSRARQLVEAAGLVVSPFPADFRPTGRARLNILSFGPISEALRQTEIAAREMYARMRYWRF